MQCKQLQDIFSWNVGRLNNILIAIIGTQQEKRKGVENEVYTANRVMIPTEIALNNDSLFTAFSFSHTRRCLVNVDWIFLIIIILSLLTTISHSKPKNWFDTGLNESQLEKN